MLSNTTAPGLDMPPRLPWFSRARMPSLSPAVSTTSTPWQHPTAKCPQHRPRHIVQFSTRPRPVQSCIMAFIKAFIKFLSFFDHLVCSFILAFPGSLVHNVCFCQGFHRLAPMSKEPLIHILDYIGSLHVFTSSVLLMYIMCYFVRTLPTTRLCHFLPLDCAIFWTHWFPDSLVALCVHFIQSYCSWMSCISQPGCSAHWRLHKVKVMHFVTSMVHSLSSLQ